ncbi:hypothetical protein PLICRDRAFT_111447 [Plicaturopsis crispa FD-325 SS-3]|nr:hypothetical protein PLICRDRAFT_111447 [Plicaturopsis crispa FD-325 SS-3]
MVLTVIANIYLIYGSVLDTIDALRSPQDPFAHLGAHCAHTVPIGASEFHQRQASLAKTLHALNASAYIAEPGASAQFYGNISGSHWHLSERPLLLIISPQEVDGQVEARVSILTPSFEATRAKLLPVPAESVTYAEWPEDANPYEVAMAAVPGLSQDGGKIFVDGMTRTFVVDGFAKAAPDSLVASAPIEIRRLRERKSPAELELMKCANEATVLAIRAVREQMYIGIRESQVRTLIRSALAAAGLTELDSLVLFGENAALPHGAGTDRVLGKSDFALIDCGGALHGYYSDVTRTFALPESDIPAEHIDIWHHVQAAQLVASHTAREGAVMSTVDVAARSVLTSEGYGKYFTHRLGHGIGLEVHEDPYLRGGSSGIIETGHAFSDEPGVYIEGQVGVRLEDCFYIEEDGSAVFLTAGVGGTAKTPTSP